MSRQYTGPCVGGPLAGQMIACLTDRYIVASRRFTPTGRINASFRMTAGKDFVYRHVQIGSTGLWALETENCDTVMRRLLAIYIAAVKEDQEDD